MGKLLLSLALLALIPASALGAEITGFALWNAQTDVRVDDDFRSGELLSLDTVAQCPAIEILTDAYLQTAGLGSVRIALDGAVIETAGPGCSEERAPFALGGDAGTFGSYNCNVPLTPGKHVLEVTGFAGDACSGAAGATQTIEFWVQERDPDPWTPSCDPVGLGLECPLRGSALQVEIPSDSQFTPDRAVGITTCCPGYSQQQETSEQFTDPTTGKVVQRFDLPGAPQEYELYHAVASICLDAPPADDTTPQCVTSPPLVGGYQDGTFLPEPGTVALALGAALVAALRRRN